MEQRLIDADALKRYIDDAEFCIKCQKKKLCCDIDCPFPAGLTEEWERAISEQPTVDAVQVVRCKDCQWFDANVDYYDSYCDKNGISVEEDFFCADGERKDGERR